MTYQTFDFPYHVPRTSYPEDQTVRFGGGYTFATKPDEKMERTFTLSFTAMKYYFDQNTNRWDDYTTNSNNNAHALEKFYIDHRMYKRFIYPHDVLGNIVVRFKKPLEMPQGVMGGTGVLPPFEVQLVEHPE